jgi:protein tyrosine phosphatase (PTP) superfamily phosphohydrolase (DUF442 family)
MATCLTCEKIERPVKIFCNVNLLQLDRFYFGGQPDKALLEWLKSQDVEAVINLRSPGEMDALKAENFDEAAIVDELGMAYVTIPMGGWSGYYPRAVDDFARAVEQYQGKLFVHCRSAGRVKLLWMAYLAQYGGFTIDEALDMGEQLNYPFILEDLLGYPLTVQKKTP